MCWIVEIFCKFAKFVFWINVNYDMSAYVTLDIMFLYYIVKWINDFPYHAIYCQCYCLYCHIKYTNPRGCRGKGLRSLRDGLLNCHTVIQEEAGVLKNHRGYVITIICHWILIVLEWGGFKGFQVLSNLISVWMVSYFWDSFRLMILIYFGSWALAGHVWISILL